MTSFLQDGWKTQPEVTGQILFLEEDNFLNGLFKRFEIDAETPFYRS